MESEHSLVVGSNICLGFHTKKVVGCATVSNRGKFVTSDNS